MRTELVIREKSWYDALRQSGGAIWLLDRLDCHGGVVILERGGQSPYIVLEPNTADVCVGLDWIRQYMPETWTRMLAHRLR